MVQAGDPIESFKGERWIFAGIARPAHGPSSGRVRVSRTCPNAYDRSPAMGGGRECVHMWHTNGVEVQEFYPSVFDLYLGDAYGMEAH